MNDDMWIKLDKQERCEYVKTASGDYAKDANGGYVRRQLPSIHHMSVKAKRTRKWRHASWHDVMDQGGWTITKHTDEQMIAEGYSKISRRFDGEVIIRADLTYRNRLYVQLPAEYGEAVVVCLAASTLAAAVCEGLVVGDRIRGPFRLLELGGRMTLTLRS